MRKLLLVILILVPLVLPLSAAPMTFAEAMAHAETIWGPSAMLGQIRSHGETYWTRQVGYKDLQGHFSVMGQGRNWDLAFANVPIGYLAPTLRILEATARDAAGNTSNAEPVITLVCNAPCVPGVVGRSKP